MNSKVMHRYTFKGIIDSRFKLAEVMKELKKSGVLRKDIDLVFSPSVEDKGFVIKKRRKGHYMALYAGVSGILLGLLIALINSPIIYLQINDYIAPAILSYFLVYGLGLGFVTAMVGFLAGWNLTSHEIIYSEKTTDEKRQILLAANTHLENKDDIENIFRNHLKQDFEVIDNNYKNEVGLR